MEAKAATSRRCFAVSGLRVVFLTLFFIALSFPPASPPRRNDANCLIRFVITVFNLVGYQQHQTRHPPFQSFAIGVLRPQFGPVPQGRRGSSKTCRVISRLTPCFRRLARALALSHSNRSMSHRY